MRGISILEGEICNQSERQSRLLRSQMRIPCTFGGYAGLDFFLDQQGSGSDNFM